MARKNRRDKRFDPAPLRLSQGPRKEYRQGREWFVREISAANANKVYRCPGCPNDIAVKQPHVVVWQAEHFFGDEFSVSERRHWHTHCWRLN